MRHLAVWLDPQRRGLTPYPVQFSRPASAFVPALLAEGLQYHHPERVEKAVVWAADAGGLPAVLAYHYGREWSDVVVLSDGPSKQ
jgi:hypothetical protein